MADGEGTGTETGAEGNGKDTSKPDEKNAPAGDEKDVDYKAKYEETQAASRKWESLAKKDKDDAAAWRKHQEEQQSEDEKRAAREKELEARATAAEQKALRADVADEKKIPVEWRSRLIGTTREELETDADELLKAIAADGGRKPDPNQGKQTETPRGDFLREAARR